MRIYSKTASLVCCMLTVFFLLSCSDGIYEGITESDENGEVTQFDESDWRNGGIIRDFYAFPNPVSLDSDGVHFAYKLTEDTSLSMVIFSPNGKIIRTLEMGYKPVGDYTSIEHGVYWNLRRDLTSSELENLTEAEKEQLQLGNPDVFNMELLLIKPGIYRAVALTTLVDEAVIQLLESGEGKEEALEELKKDFRGIVYGDVQIEQ